MALSQWEKAVQVIHYGHATRVLSHFSFLDAPLKEQSAAGSADPEGLFLELAGSSFESTVIILLAWAFNLQEAFAVEPQPYLDQLVAFHFGESPSSDVSHLIYCLPSTQRREGPLEQLCILSFVRLVSLLLTLISQRF